MTAEWLRILTLYLVVLVVARSVFALARPAARNRGRAVLARVVRRRSNPSSLPVRAAPSRPLETAVRDLRRLGPRFHHPPPGTSRTKLEATRHAYDRALAEAATALEIVHLLDVLEPGPELDAERRRVESRLWLAGVRVDEAA